MPPGLVFLPGFTYVVSKNENLSEVCIEMYATEEIYLKYIKM
jgi:hypothetical protein